MKKNNDTDLLLTIGMDATDALQTSKDLKQEVDKIFDARKGKQSAALTSVQVQLKQAVKAVDDVNKKISQIGEQKIATPEFTKLQDRLKALQKESETITTKSLKFAPLEEEFNQLGDKFAEVSQKVQEEERKLKEAQEALKKSPGDIFKQAAVTRSVEALSNLRSEAESLEQQMNNTKFDALKQAAEDEAELSKQIHAVEEEMRKLEQQGKAFSIVNPEETEEYKKLVAQRDVLNDKLKHSIIQHQEINKREQDKLNKQKEQETSLKKLAKSHGDVNKAISKGFKNILKWGFGIRSVFILVRKLRQFFSEGFKNLQASGLSKLTEQMNELKMSTQTLQNALASAFEPIVTTIIPYVQRLVDNLIQVIDKFAQLTAAAKGQKTYIKAIRQTGEALKKMGESANKALGPLDDLNVIQGTQQFEEVEIPEDTFNQVEELGELFTPIKTSIDDMMNSLKKLYETVGSNLKDFYDNVLVPIGQWFITEASPEIINTFAAALDLLNTAIVELKPYAEWLYENFLKPLGELAWDVIKEGLEHIQHVLKELNDLISGDKSFEEFLLSLDGADIAILAIATAIGAVCAVLAIMNTVMTIASGVMSLFGAIVAAVTSPITLIVLAIMAVIAAGVLLYLKWDDICTWWSKTWSDTVDNIREDFYTFMSDVVDPFIEVWNKLAKRFGWQQIETFADKWAEEVRKENELADQQRKAKQELTKAINNNKINPFPGSTTYNQQIDSMVRGSIIASGQSIPPDVSAAITSNSKTSSQTVDKLTEQNSTLDNILSMLARVSNNLDQSKDITLDIDGQTLMKAMIKQDDAYKKQHGGQSAFAN